MVEFVTVLAWIFGVISTGFVILRLIAWSLYSEIDKLQHTIRGVEATFPVVIPGTLAIFCWTWIITM